MSGWQVGDLALCISSGVTVRAGEVNTVDKVWPDTGGLTLRGKFSTSRRGSYYPHMFIKVTPPEADEFDREVIEHLTGAPVEEKA